jgi:hypothetical protein
VTTSAPGGTVPKGTIAKREGSPQVNAAVFAFPGLNYTVGAEGSTLERPAYEDNVFMWNAEGERAEVHKDSIGVMEALGWAMVPSNG